MERWKNGILGMKGRWSPGINYNERHLDKSRSHPPNPVFQHSIIPIPQSIGLRQGRWSLTRPTRPGFQCWNNYSQHHWCSYPTSSYHVNIIYNNAMFPHRKPVLTILKRFKYRLVNELFWFKEANLKKRLAIYNYCDKYSSFTSGNIRGGKENKAKR